MMKRNANLLDLFDIVYPHGSIFEPLKPKYKVDRSENGDYQIIFEIPGISPDKIEIEIVNTKDLHVKVPAKGGDVITYSFAIPDNASASDISAKTEHGLLTVTLPRVKDKTKKIKVVAV